ncbi:MAG: Trm112 family protein [Gemmatimonadota bacterium]
MIDSELLELLVCPETKQSLSLADGDMLQTINGAIGNGEVVTRGGEALSESIEGGLVREDGQVLYPVRDGIPIMLIQESVQLPQQA